MATSLPEWRSPVGKTRGLNVYNSLTRSKKPFIPIDPEGKIVTWYACGPTVYDDSHLGHARNYISQDIIRRVMTDYFKYSVNFVMNITDVDDKIILAARQKHLLERFIRQQEGKLNEEVLGSTRKAFHAYVTKNLPLLDPDVEPTDYQQAELQAYPHILKENPVLTEIETKLKMHLTIARDASQALQHTDLPLNDFTSKASGVLHPYLDSLYAETVKGQDHDIFTNLTKQYERRFFEDMDRLNVRYPDKVTRVTEYGPQIVDFVKQIQGNGFAYEHEGSVYYDVPAWQETGGIYARLEPWNKNDKDLQADGEGSLSAKKTGFKKSGADFALWKASKAGEPSWDSPWGHGRPGWHIECSAMASDVLGKQIDIHSGGIDLAFPHHDNELAQSEAYWAKSGKESEQWVNYFLHMGHLGIAGAKMSKSLKNFISIKDALDSGLYTPRSLRIAFLLGAWKDPLEISTKPDVASDTNANLVAWEEKVNNFFLKVRDLQINPSNGTSDLVHGDAAELKQLLESSKQRLDEALKDSFDTPAAMRIISELITSYNSATDVPTSTAIAIGEWVTDIVVLFGLDADHTNQLGWSGIDIPERAKPFIYPLSNLRYKVREQAKKGAVDLASLGRLDEKDNSYNDDQPYAKALAEFERTIVKLCNEKAAKSEYLQACDHVRDNVLWDLGIYLEDRDGRPALVRPLSEALRKERQDREGKAAQKAAEAEKKKAEAAAKERERLEKGKLSPQEMFKTEEFSEWDGEGMPTKDKEGNEVAKSRLKKLRKDWERQKKLHEEYEKSEMG